jgi:DNA uptake protein ComE-like DNA-binding protein
MARQNWLTAARNLLGQSLAAKIKNDPFYRFQTLAEIQTAARLGITIDVNQASVDDWLRLPGISIHQARVLVNLTQAGVTFHSLEDVAAGLGVPPARLQPLSPILSFYYYDPESVCLAQPVNVNRATLEALLQVPMIDASLARTIVTQRSSAGPYRNLADLQKRLALPAALTAQLMHYLRF